MVIGKGSAMARAEKYLEEFINCTNIPFLPTPMGRGVISDNHLLNSSSSRSLVIGINIYFYFSFPFFFYSTKQIK